MEIRYIGHSSFILKNKQAAVVTDPFDSENVGLKFPKSIEADIVTVSHDHFDHNAVSRVTGNPFVISKPGEYEVKTIGVTGFPSYHDSAAGAERGKNTIFRYEMDNLNICHLGDLGHVLTDAEVERLDGIDVLMIPVGGFYTISPEEASKIIAEIEPSLVLPMHYGRDDLNQKQFGSLKSLADFLKVCEITDINRVSKLTLTRDKLPEQIQVVIFE